VLKYINIIKINGINLLTRLVVSLSESENSLTLIDGDLLSAVLLLADPRDVRNMCMKIAFHESKSIIACGTGLENVQKYPRPISLGLYLKFETAAVAYTRNNRYIAYDEH